MTSPLPMFPLGTVLLPGMGLPLHIFEPRYRQLVVDCLAGTQEFGVTLIERGSEVGGGDLRTGVGTIAHIADARRLEDGRWLLTAIGTRRIRVTRWLDDDPYPRAEVLDWPDPSALTTDGGLADGGFADGGLADGQLAEMPLADAVAAGLRRVLALRAELGDPSPDATIDLGDDPVVATWRAAALSGLGPLDLQRVLATEGVDRRARVVSGLLGEMEELLRGRVLMDGA